MEVITPKIRQISKMMMAEKTESQTSQDISKDITARFFETLDLLIQEKKFKSIRAFCVKHDFNYPNVMRMSYPDYNRKPTYELLFCLHRFYQINLNWLITGEGEKKNK